MQILYWGGDMMKRKKDEQLPQQPLFPITDAFGLSNMDPLGSYTGIPVPPDEYPVQDADDL